MKYRVLMEDSVNGEKFNFAMIYETDSNDASQIMAAAEFPGATIVSVDIVQPNMGDLLQQAIDSTKGLYSQAA